MCFNLTLDQMIPRKLGQYYGCLWPGDLCHQAINSHGINCVNNSILFFHDEESQLPKSFQCCEMIENAKILQSFFYKNQLDRH